MLIFLLILLIFNWLLIFFGVFRTAAVNFSALNSRGARRPAASPLCPPFCPSAPATTNAAAALAAAWDRARLGLVKGEASGAQARPALAQPAVRAGFPLGAAAGRPGCCCLFSMHIPRDNLSALRSALRRAEHIERSGAVCA